MEYHPFLGVILAVSFREGSCVAHPAKWACKVGLQVGLSLPYGGYNQTRIPTLNFLDNRLQENPRPWRIGTQDSDTWSITMVIVLVKGSGCKKPFPNGPTLWLLNGGY